MDNWVEEQISRNGKARIFKQGVEYTVTLSPRGLFMVKGGGWVQAFNNVRDAVSSINRKEARHGHLAGF